MGRAREGTEDESTERAYEAIQVGLVQERGESEGIGEVEAATTPTLRELRNQAMAQTRH
jgi:hypothetical protein